MAKKFTFRAESVLKLREQAEQSALRKMGEARRRVSAIEDGIRQLRAELAEQDRRVREGVLTGEVDVQYMSLYRRHVMMIHRRMIEMGRRLHEAAGVLGRCRAEAVEAMKQRKVLSTLKDKRRARHMADLEREQLRDSDDMNLMRVAHRGEDPWN